MDERALALDALHAIDAGCTRDEWIKTGFAALAAGLELEDVNAWSASAGNYKGERDVLLAFGRKAPRKVTAGTLFFLAQAAGWKRPRDAAEIKPRPVPAKLTQQPVERPTRAGLSDYARQLWSACRPLSGPALAYLQARCCVVPPGDGDLRWHPELRHPCGYVGPALVGLVTHAATREPMSLHRTWIRPDGTKPPEVGDAARLMLKDHAKQGGVIRLWPDEAVAAGLGVGEGIESCLSLAHAYAPVWSLIDAGNLAGFPVLPGVECLLIAADHDQAGVKAARSCARRWHEAGARVRIVLPPEQKTDLNDIAKEAA